MLAKDVSIHRDIYCTSDIPLQSVFQILLDNDCGCVTIVESLAHKDPIGSVSERDICLKVIKEGLNPHRLTAARVMNGNITKVSSEISVKDCLLMIGQPGVERLVVVDEKGAYTGIITEQNLVSEKSERAVESLASPALKVRSAVSQELHLAF